MGLPFALDRSHLRAGMRLALAVSGGADSVALLRSMVEAAPQIGLVLSVIHVHHGIRGRAADEDAAFVEALAARHGLSFHLHRVDTPAHAERQHETLEEAARHLRYAVFRELMKEKLADAVATAHTLDDQAETVLLKLLRGAWTEGLSGIHPVVTFPEGIVLRPLLEVRRAQIETWLHEMDQPWCEDVTNRDTAFLRNRVRHELLPQLASYNPQITLQLSHMAELARDEESYWKQEMERLLPTMLLPGRAVRGGGRAVSTQPGEASVGLELERLRTLPIAVRRRVMREAAFRFGVSLGFEPVARLLQMVEASATKPAPRREQLTAELRAERTPRELRLILDHGAAPGDKGRRSAQSRLAPVEISVPGETDAPEYGLRITVTRRDDGTMPADSKASLTPLTLRPPKPGDRVRLRYTSGKKPLKEVFQRLHLDASRRPTWPLIAWRDEVIWMKDVPLEPDPTLPFTLEVIPMPETKD